MQIDSGGGNICYTEEGDGFLDPAAEYTESTSENEENSSHEDCISDTLEKMSDSNEDRGILEKHQLEYMKTEIEIMLGDNNVEPDLASDLTDTDEEEGNSGKDGDETDGNLSSSSSIREVIYDDNVCEKYNKPANNQLPPIAGMLTSPPQRLPKEGANVLRNVPQGMVIQSRFASEKSSIGTSRRSQHEDSSAAGLAQRAQVASTMQPCS